MASSASYYLRVDIDDTSDESPEDEPARTRTTLL